MSLLGSLHRFLVIHRFYALSIASALAVACLLGRMHLTGRWDYIFLLWNLFLAWLPYLASLWAASLHQRYPRHPHLLLLPSAGWLLFLPNAPYLVTDFIHFRHIDSVPWWADLGLLALFAWSGCALAVTSLRAMQEIVRSWVGGLLSWLFVLLVSALAGFGIYLGRFGRWNSWDLLFQPTPLLSEIASFLQTPLDHPQMVGVSALFATFIFVCYITLAPPRPTPSGRSARTSRAG